MLYYLFDWLNNSLDVPGTGVFQYISFRAAAAVITSLLITIVFGKRLINFLKKKQVGETVRDLGLQGQKEKEGTPTMGGLIILGAILIPTLLFAKLENIYIIIMLITTIWLGALGFLDDYIKVFRKNKAGLSGKLKIVGQVILGIVVGSMIYFHPDMTIKEKQEIDPQFEYNAYVKAFFSTCKGYNLNDAIRCWNYKKAKALHPIFEESDLEVLEK